MASDDYHGTTARIYTGDKRLIEQLQIDLKPVLKHRPSVAEVVHIAIQAYVKGRITSG